MELDQFSRTRLVIGDEALDRLSHARVCVFGMGGVGGAVVEGLARCGVGALDLVDNDTVSITNVNRQIIALLSTVGRDKVDCAAERVADINPACVVRRHKMFYLPETKDAFDFAAYDYIVDAVDTVAAKLSIIEEAHRTGTPVISAMGAGNKMNPAAFRVADISKTSVDPLAKVIRKELRRRGIRHLKVVYSPEPPAAIDAARAEKKASGRPAPGSISFVPPVVGMIMASEVVRDLIAAPADAAAATAGDAAAE
jgi:tRNA A37 threonylcarbamoyladenosine dehydratase